MQNRIAAIVVAAGRGERAGRHVDGPKQYRRIGGRAVVARTLETLAHHPRIAETVLVVHPDDEALVEKALADESVRPTLVTGGASRQESVFRGLEALRERACDAVLVHDAVRPFADIALIDRLLDALDAGATAAVPGLAIADTLKRVDANANVVATIDRTGLYAAQTPQAFECEALFAAHAAAAQANTGGFTDDASIAQWAGLAVRIVAGLPENVKLTTARDIELADEQLTRNTAGAAMIDVRTGNGYDVHRLVPGDAVTLCGVSIPHTSTLDGHSDADVGLHALTDALLATCGAGDIGDHFPPSDPQWKGAASSRFVEHAVSLVAERGGRIMNADVTLVCEAPKIGPHRAAMCAAIAGMTGLSPDRVSVKATTNESLGFLGRREGIAAIATASVDYGGRA